jgi:hypothetical protein
MTPSLSTACPPTQFRRYSEFSDGALSTRLPSSTARESLRLTCRQAEAAPTMHPFAELSPSRASPVTHRAEGCAWSSLSR